MINAKQLSYILWLTLLIQIVGCFSLTIFANNWLTTKSEKLVTLKLDTIELEKKQEAGTNAAKELKYYETTRILLEKIVPKSKDQAKAIGEFLNIATEVGVSIDTITFPSSELGTKSTAPAKVSTSASAAATDTTAITQAKPVANIPGLLGIEVGLSQIKSKSINAGGGISYKQLITFLEAVEKNRRTMQIKNLEVQPIKTPTGAISGYYLTLTINIFVKP